MKRRDFLAAGAAGLTLAALGNIAAEGRAAAEDAATPTNGKPLRVGLIGCGWYGKCDLLRLIQVAPVEVVSLCDVDAKMLAAAAELVATRQASKKAPRTYADYREMLKEKDLDIVLIGTPDHWHALAMIAAVEAGADVYVQKPISVDIREGAAMLAAARRTQRVVQVGMQRRSTPHLIEARDAIIKTGKLGKVALVEICCYYHMRATANPPDEQPPANLDWEMWTGPAPMRPYNRIAHPRGWRAFNEYGNGIVGDMCVHMLDMVRWMLGWLGEERRLDWRHPGRQGQQGQHPRHPARHLRLRRRPGGVAAPHLGRGTGPQVPWAATIYGDKARSRPASWLDFIPSGKGEEPIHQDVVYELDQFPRTRPSRRSRSTSPRRSACT